MLVPALGQKVKGACARKVPATFCQGADLLASAGRSRAVRRALGHPKVAGTFQAKLPATFVRRHEARKNLQYKE